MTHSHRTRTLWLIGTLHAFTHLYQVALLPLYLRIQQDLHLRSIDQATLLVTVLGVAYFLPSYPLGVLADRLNRKSLLSLGLLINGLGFVGLSLAPNYGLALVSVAITGFGGTFYHPAATSLVARLFPEARGKALGLVGIGASVGFFAGPVYAGWRAASSSWRQPVLELGLFGIIAAGLFAWLAKGEERPKSAEPLRTTHVKAAIQLFPNASLWAFFLLAAFALSMRDFAGSGVSTSASLFLQNAYGFSPKLTGLMLSGIFIASVISNPLFGSLSDAGRMRWVAFVLVVAAGLVSLFPRMPALWFGPILLGYGFFFMASYPITEAALMESVPDAIRGRVFGLFITIGGLVGNLSHWAVGSWIQHLGSRASTVESYLPLYAVLSLMLLASVAGLPLLHALRKREHMTVAHAAMPPLSALHEPDRP